MLKKFITGSVLTGATAIIAVLSLAATAQAAGDTPNGTKAYGYNSDEGWASWVDDGDDLYIKDTKADGYSVWVEVATSWATNHSYNLTSGAGTAQLWNFGSGNVPEGEFIIVQVCRGDYGYNTDDCGRGVYMYE